MSLRRVDLERVLPVLVTLPVVVEAELPKKRGLSTFKFGILCWRKKRIENWIIDYGKPSYFGDPSGLHFESFVSSIACPEPNSNRWEICFAHVVCKVDHKKRWLFNRIWTHITRPWFLNRVRPDKYKMVEKAFASSLKYSSVRMFMATTELIYWAYNMTSTVGQFKFRQKSRHFESDYPRYFIQRVLRHLIIHRNVGPLCYPSVLRIVAFIYDITNHLFGTHNSESTTYGQRETHRDKRTDTCVNIITSFVSLNCYSSSFNAQTKIKPFF